MWVWSAVVLAVLSSRMSAGGCSLAGRRDNVPPCLAMFIMSVCVCVKRKKKWKKTEQNQKTFCETTRYRSQKCTKTRKLTHAHYLVDLAGSGQCCGAHIHGEFCSFALTAVCARCTVQKLWRRSHRSKAVAVWDWYRHSLHSGSDASSTGTHFSGPSAQRVAHTNFCFFLCVISYGSLPSERADANMCVTSGVCNM